MSHVNVIRAWKDPEYRARLSAAERANLPENPAGWIELDGTALDTVVGGLALRAQVGPALSPITRESPAKPTGGSVLCTDNCPGVSLAIEL